MGPVSYGARSMLRAHRARSVGIALVVAAVGTLVLTLAAGVSRTVSAPDRYTAALGDAGGVVLEQQGGRPRTAELRALAAVASVETASFVFGGVMHHRRTELVEGFVFAGAPRALGAQITEGREADPSAPGEFVATRSWIGATGARIGDTFRLVTITQEGADRLGFEADPTGPQLAATLVGVMDGPNDIQDPTPLALFPPSLLDVGDVGIATTVGAVSLAPGASIDDLRAQLDALPNGDVFGLEPAEWVPDDVRAAVSAQGQGLAVVAAIVAVAGIAVVGQLVSRQGRVPAGQRLALRAIGLTRTQVIAMSSCSIVVPVCVGATVAAVASVVASSRFPVGLARRLDDAGVLFDPLVHVAAAVVFAAAVAAWVLVSMLVGDRQHPARAHRGLAEVAVSRMPTGPAATGSRYALIRHPRDPGSVRASVVGLVLVQTVLVGAVTFGASVDRVIDVPARHGSNFDFATGSGEDEVPREVLELLEQDPDVADLTLYGTSFASVGATSLDVTGMERVRGRLEPDVLAGRLPTNAGEMVLGRTSARELEVEIGDDLLVGAQGPQAFRVTGFAVLPSIEGGDGIGEGGLVTLDGLRRLEPDAKLGVAAVRLQPGATDAAERIGAAIGRTVGLPDPPPAIVNLDRVRSTPYIVAWSLGAFAVLSMSHQLVTSARRRRRDLAIVRALGAERRWVSRVLHWQVTVLALAATTLSLPLGVAAGRLAYHTYIDRIGGRTDLSVPYRSLLVVVTGLLVLGNVAAQVAARGARREPPGRAETAG